MARTLYDNCGSSRPVSLPAASGLPAPIASSAARANTVNTTGRDLVSPTTFGPRSLSAAYRTKCVLESLTPTTSVSPPCGEPGIRTSVEGLGDQICAHTTPRGLAPSLQPRCAATWL